MGAAVNLNRLIASLYLVLLAGLGVVAAVLFFEAQGEYNRLRQTELVNQRRLADVQARLHEQEVILERLRTDPTYVEKVIRLRLGWARRDEFIFRFEN